MRLQWLAPILCVVAFEAPAHAISASCRSSDWSVADGTTLPTHARIGYYIDKGEGSPGTLVAKIDGKDVPTKITWITAGPFKMATIEIDSDRTGKLALSWQSTNTSFDNTPNATFTIAAHVREPTEVHGKTERFYRAFFHSTVHESWDGLAVRVDSTVIMFKVKWRRDDLDAWQELVVPGDTLDIANTLHLGEISCVANFSVPMLEHGVDLDITAQLPDGTWVKVTGLPAHVVLPKLAPGTAVSQP